MKCKKIYLDIGREKVIGTGMAVYTKAIHDGLNKANANICFIEVPITDNTGLLAKINGYFCEQIILPLKMFINNGICHRTANLGVPFLCLGRYIVTIHDIIPLIFPKQYLPNKIRRIWFTVRQIWTAKMAKIIIADSMATKNDLVNRLNINENKIKVIYIGIDSIYKPSNDLQIQLMKEKYNIITPYILGMGGTEFRKNANGLIDAFKSLKEKYGIPHKLVIIGKQWNNKDFSNDKDIIFTGFADTEDLPHLYSEADVFVFPSLYEGFGMPILEAQACGTPVVTSNVSSMPEVAGDSASLVNPNDVNDIANGIYSILSNEKLKEDLIRKGFDNIKRFSWEKSVQELIRIYEGCMDEERTN
ncbi:MAG: glycosyltransferase family 1 protein [Oscillospiraceae bacterium]